MFGQSLAVGGLARAGTAPSTAAVDFLRAQQCPDGGFPVFVADGCLRATPTPRRLAVQALIRVAGAEDDDAQEGLDYLAAQQDEPPAPSAAPAPPRP